MDIFSTYKEKSPEVFQRLTGVNMGTFQIILAKYKKELAIYKSEKPFRKNGRKSKMTIENQLLLCLLYLRDYTTFIKLGLVFGISESYAQKRFELSKMILLRCLDLPDSESLQKNLETHLIAIDVTEQEIERPLENQGDYYSGKKNDIP